MNVPPEFLRLLSQYLCYDLTSITKEEFKILTNFEHLDEIRNFLNILSLELLSNKEFDDFISSAKEILANNFRDYDEDYENTSIQQAGNTISISNDTIDCLNKSSEVEPIKSFLSNEELTREEFTKYNDCEEPFTCYSKIKNKSNFKGKINLCGCDARQHLYHTNCIFCGYIHCKKELSINCLCCGKSLSTDFPKQDKYNELEYQTSKLIYNQCNEISPYIIIDENLDLFSEIYSDFTNESKQKEIEKIIFELSKTEDAKIKTNINCYDYKNELSYLSSLQKIKPDTKRLTSFFNNNILLNNLKNTTFSKIINQVKIEGVDVKTSLDSSFFLANKNEVLSFFEKINY